MTSFRYLSPKHSLTHNSRFLFSLHTHLFLLFSPFPLLPKCSFLVLHLTQKSCSLPESMAASSDSFAKSHVQNQRRQSKSSSCSGALCKFLVMLLVLVLVPTFPSQAPEFVNNTIFKEFWELFHLLVIGIAVSYGLFCRKSGTVGVVDEPRDEFRGVNLSGFLNVPPVFEDGAEKLSISDENENVSLQNLGSFYSAEGKKVGFLKGGNGGRNVDEVGDENPSQIRRLKRFQGENLLVVADGNCGLDEYKPLGLPVRSLRSRNADSSNYFEGSFGKVEKVRGLVPINLEKKFDEVSGSHDSDYLQPKPERMEVSEESSDFGLSCHCRSHSGMKHLRSRSSRYPKSSERESFEVNKEANGFAVNVPSVPKARGLSIGSSKELDEQRRPSKEFFNDSTLSAMQHVLDREKKKASDRLTSNAKPSRFAKVLSRGRSVRTIRSRVFASDEMNRKEASSDQTEEKIDGKNDLFEAPALEKKVKGGEVKYQNSEKVYPVLKETFPLLPQNNEGQDFVDTDSALLSEMGSESDSEPEDLPQPQGSLDEKKAEPNSVAEDAELEGSEVDRKADEFIAKFREQMRLQKIASLKRN